MIQPDLDEPALLTRVIRLCKHGTKCHLCIKGGGRWVRVALTSFLTIVINNRFRLGWSWACASCHPVAGDSWIVLSIPVNLADKGAVLRGCGKFKTVPVPTPTRDKIVTVSPVPESHLINNKQDDWSEWLLIAQFCHNDRQHLATKHSPFFLNYGRHRRKGIKPLPNLTVPAVETILENMAEAQNKASVALKEAAERMKIQYDKNRQKSQQYKKGNKVYIKAEHLPVQGASKKLDQRYYGLYEVVEAVGPSAYRIRIPVSWKTYNVFNEVLLKPYYAPRYPRQKAIEEEKRNEQEGETAENEYKVHQEI